MLLLSADAHHHRSPDLLRQQCRDDREDVACGFAAKTASGVLANQKDLALIHVQPARQARQGLHGALRSHVNEHLAILLISQSRARLQRLVTGIGGASRSPRSDDYSVACSIVSSTLSECLA